MHRVTALAGSRILLSRYQNTAVALEAAGLAPSRLLEVRAGDVPHLQQVADVEILGGDLTPDGGGAGTTYEAGTDPSLAINRTSTASTSRHP